MADDQTAQEENVDSTQDDTEDKGDYAYSQRAVLYTDGLSGGADSNTDRAYRNSELRADLHKEVDQDYLPNKDAIVTEEQRREAAPSYDKVG